MSMPYSSSPSLNVRYLDVGTLGAWDARREEVERRDEVGSMGKILCAEALVRQIGNLMLLAMQAK